MRLDTWSRKYGSAGVSSVMHFGLEKYKITGNENKELWAHGHWMSGRGRPFTHHPLCSEMLSCIRSWIKRHPSCLQLILGSLFGNRWSWQQRNWLVVYLLAWAFYNVAWTVIACDSIGLSTLESECIQKQHRYDVIKQLMVEQSLN